MKLIKINTDHYVVVDDSEIKEGDWLYSFDNGLIVQANRGSADTINSKSLNGRGYGKITHSTQPLESMNHGNYSSNVYLDIEKLSLQEVKELIGEVDVEQYAWDNPVLSRKDVYELFNDVFKDKIIEGTYRISASKQVYQFDTKLRELAKQKALEDNKEKKYTEEDMKYMFECGRNYQNNAEVTFKMSMEYLQQPKTEWEVEFIDGKLKLK